MGKKLPHTPRSRIKSTLRALFLRSREHAAALKNANNTCEVCGAKKSMAKGREVRVEVHHNRGVINWDHIYETIYKHLLCDPKDMTILCKPCHLKVHETGEL